MSMFYDLTLHFKNGTSKKVRVISDAVTAAAEAVGDKNYTTVKIPHTEGTLVVATDTIACVDTTASLGVW